MVVILASDLVLDNRIVELHVPFLSPSTDPGSTGRLWLTKTGSLNEAGYRKYLLELVFPYIKAQRDGLSAWARLLKGATCALRFG